MKKARPRPPPPPAPPDSAEEPFWNFNWKHFPPKLPEKGRERGSAPPLPIGESLGVTSKPLLPARDEDDGARSRNAKRGSNGAHRETPRPGWDDGMGDSPTGRDRRVEGGMGSTPVLAPHHAFKEACAGCAALRAGPQIPACPPGTPRHYQGLPRLSKKGLSRNSRVF